MLDVFGIRYDEPVCAADFCTEEGAKELERRIREYWAARGGLVNTDRRYCAFTTPMRRSRYDVRSDMRNGYPAQWFANALPSQQEAA